MDNGDNDFFLDGIIETNDTDETVIISNEGGNQNTNILIVTLGAICILFILLGVTYIYKSKNGGRKWYKGKRVVDAKLYNKENAEYIDSSDDSDDSAYNTRHNKNNNNNINNIINKNAKCRWVSSTLSVQKGCNVNRVFTISNDAVLDPVTRVCITNVRALFSQSTDTDQRRMTGLKLTTGGPVYYGIEVCPWRYTKQVVLSSLLVLHRTCPQRMKSEGKTEYDDGDGNSNRDGDGADKDNELCAQIVYVDANRAVHHVQNYESVHNVGPSTVLFLCNTIEFCCPSVPGCFEVRIVRTGTCGSGSLGSRDKNTTSTTPLSEESVALGESSYLQILRSKPHVD